MGLTEKRAIKTFQDTVYPALEKEINTTAGYPIEFDIKWDTLAVAEYAHLYNEGFTKIYFTPVINAFKNITADDLGKEALKETVKKIVIKNENENYSYNNAYTLDNGVLTIDHQPNCNIDDIAGRSEELIKFLSAKM